MFCTESKKIRIPDPPIIYDGALVTMEVSSSWQSSSNLDDGGIIERFHDKIERMEEDKDPEN